MRSASLSRSLVLRSIFRHLVPSLAVASAAVATGLFAGCAPQGAEPETNAAATDKPDLDEQALGTCATGTKYCQYDDGSGTFAWECCSGTDVCGAAGCEAAPAPVAYDNGTITFGYEVLTLVYSPPGKLSEVDYQSASSTGTHTENKKSFSSAISVGIESDFVDASAKFTAGVAKGTSFELKKTTGSVVGSDAAGRPNDELDCTRDRFYLWVKPTFKVIQTADNAFKLKVPEVTQSNIVQVTIAEAKNPALITDWRAPLLSHLRAVDYQHLLTLDPCTSGDGIAAPRFQLVDERDLTGPSQPNGDIRVSGTIASNEIVKGQFQIASKEVAVEIIGKVGIPNFGPKLTVGGEWTFGMENTQETTTGESQEAQALLKTDTVGYHAVYRIYYDTIYRTFAFKKLVPVSGSQTVSGFVGDANGAPVAGAEVAIQQSNGIVRHVRTGSSGYYSALYVPQGNITVSSGSMVSSAYVGSSSATVNLEPAFVSQ
jgi:hypothetical protein